MSTTETTRPTGRLAAPSSTTFSQDDCPTEIIPVVAPAAPVPVRRSILHSAAGPGPFDGWRGQAWTEELPAVTRVSTPAEPTRGRGTRRTAPTGTEVHHLRAALAGLPIAAAILIPMQLFAAHGISSARQAALSAQAARTEQATEQTAPTSPAPSEQAEQADAPAAQWAIEGTTTAAPSPLDLPRCTTSPDTPLPCLATIYPDSRRAVVLEEDASLTALVLR